MSKKIKIVFSALVAVVLVVAVACFVLAGCFREAPETPVVSEPEVIVDSSDIVEIDPVENDPVVSEPVVSEPAASEPVESKAPDAKEETPSKPASDKKGNTSSTPPKSNPKTSTGQRFEDLKPGDMYQDPFTGEWRVVEEGLGGGRDVTDLGGGEYLGK